MKSKTNLSLIKIKNSKIHGSGVFASQDIKKGAKIIEYIGEKITKKESEKRADYQLKKSKNHTTDGGVYIFELNKKYDLDGNFSWNPARLINHSCEPNCETEIDKDRIWVIALRDIKKGEELSYDYGYDFNNWEDHPCKCGSKNCVKYIVGEKHKNKLKKILAYQKP